MCLLNIVDSVWLLFVAFTRIDAFYVTKNVFNWANAELYCRNYCESRFGIIHNDEEFKHIQQIIQHTSNYWDSNENTWIGLNADPFPAFQWSDNASLFDSNFGNNIAGGVYPWSINQPDGNGKECVMMVHDAHYLWSDSGCQPLRKALCNDCDSILNKYIISKQITNPSFAQAENECKSRFGTSLASLYTQRDYSEAVTLCRLFGKSCWVNNENSSSQDCVELDKQTDFMVHSFECNATEGFRNYVLCDAPSELCSFETNWTLLNINGSLSLDNCTIELAEANAVILDKQWYNSNDVLMVDYMYSAEFNTSLNDQHSGLTIYTSLCQFYYVFIDGYNLTVSYQIGMTEQILHTTPLMLVGEYYVLSVQITKKSNETMFEISVNDIVHISYTHSTILNNIDGYSGYIGIQSNVNTKAKSLYVSGTALKMNNNTTMNTSEICTITTKTPSDSVETLTSNPSMYTTQSSLETSTTSITDFGVTVTTPLYSTQSWSQTQSDSDESAANDNQLIAMEDSTESGVDKHVSDTMTTTGLVINEPQMKQETVGIPPNKLWLYFMGGFIVALFLFLSIGFGVLYRGKKMIKLHQETTLATLANIQSNSRPSPTSPASITSPTVCTNDDTPVSVDFMDEDTFETGIEIVTQSAVKSEFIKQIELQIVSDIHENVKDRLHSMNLNVKMEELEVKSGELSHYHTPCGPHKQVAFIDNKEVELSLTNIIECDVDDIEVDIEGNSDISNIAHKRKATAGVLCDESFVDESEIYHNRKQTVGSASVVSEFPSIDIDIEDMEIMEDTLRWDNDISEYANANINDDEFIVE